MASTIWKVDPQEAARSYATVVDDTTVAVVVRLLCEPSDRYLASRDEPLHASLWDLWGLGRDVWDGVDAVGYVRNLRDEWDR